MDKEVDIIVLLLNMLITVVVYEAVPLLLKYGLKKHYDDKQAKKVAIVNSVVGYLLFMVWYIAIESENTANMSAAWIWGYVAYRILRPAKEREELKETEEEVKSFSKGFVVSLVIVVVVLAGIVVVSLYVSLEDDFTGLQAEKEVWMAKEKEYVKKIKGLESENKDLERLTKDYAEMWDKVSFMDSHVVIVPNNTYIFHKFDCPYLDTSDGGLVYNPENAEAEGFVPCSKCMK